MNRTVVLRFEFLVVGIVISIHSVCVLELFRCNRLEIQSA